MSVVNEVALDEDEIDMAVKVPNFKKIADKQRNIVQRSEED